MKELLKTALTDLIEDRAMFMKGIDYSYYYEEDDTTLLQEAKETKCAGLGNGL